MPLAASRPEPQAAERGPAVLPSCPPHIREPLHLGSLALPSRFSLAPLAGYTNLPFRLAMRAVGGLGLATTDLVNGRALLMASRKTMQLIETCPADRPLAVQITVPFPRRWPTPSSPKR